MARVRGRFLKDIRREAILRAAWQCAAKYGFAKSTIQEIAREAGLAKGTIYNYFEKKEDILLALVEAANRKVLDMMEDVATSTLTAKKKLEKMLLARVLYIYDTVGRSPHGEEIIPSHKPAIVGSLDWFFRKQKRLYEQVIREGNKAGEFNEKSPSTAAEVLGNLSELLTPPYYRLVKRSQVKSFARNLLKRFITGISRDGAKSARRSGK